MGRCCVSAGTAAAAAAVVTERDMLRTVPVVPTSSDLCEVELVQEYSARLDCRLQAHPQPPHCSGAVIASQLVVAQNALQACCTC